MTMSIGELKARAYQHWEEHRPITTAQLEEEGRLDESIQVAATQAHNLIRELMQYQHYQAHEAEEVALRQYILLTPDDVPYDQKPLWEQELDDEMAEKEARWQEWVDDMEEIEALREQEYQEEMFLKQEETRARRKQEREKEAQQQAAQQNNPA